MSAKLPEPRLKSMLSSVEFIQILYPPISQEALMTGEAPGGGISLDASDVQDPGHQAVSFSDLIR